MAGGVGDSMCYGEGGADKAYTPSFQYLSELGEVAAVVDERFMRLASLAVGSPHEGGDVQAMHTLAETQVRQEFAALLGVDPGDLVS